jgi:flagellar hook-length control protein FliK
MAAIASNPIFSAGASGAGANVSGAGANTNTNAPADGAPANAAPSDFLQLVSGLAQGKTSGNQLPSNLLELLLSGDSAGLGGVDGLETTDKKETDTTDSGDDDSSEAGALALSALLAGLQGSQPAPVASSSGDGTAGVGSIETSQKMIQSLLETTQGALASALDAADGKAEAKGAGGTDGTTTANGAGAGASQTSAAHTQNLLQAHRAAEAAPQAASAEVRTPVGAAGWGDEIGTHLAIMAANGRETASLRLSPEHLGPLDIQISVKDGQTNIVFGASNADTRSALEQSIPRLREMFASQGLVLGDANVSRDAPRDSFKPSTFASSRRGSSDASTELDVKAVTLSRLGLVDTYV